MNNTIEITGQEMSSFENIQTINCETESPRLGIHIIMGMTALIGIWGTTCIVNGLAATGSLQEVGRGLVTALTGI